MKIQKYQWGNPVEEWGSQWKERLRPSGGSKVIQKWNATGKKPKPESSTEKARKQAQPQRTWRSDVADTFHNIGEGVLALSPYTAVPYYGAKVGQDFLNGNVGVHTALNASVPLLSYVPQIKIPIKYNKNIIINQQAKVSDLLNNNMYITKDIIDGAKEGFKDSYKYYSSDKYLEHLKSTGLSEIEAKELQDFKLNNLLETRINFTSSDPAEYGRNTINNEGIVNTELNPQMSNTKNLARETVWHETGGHAASKNYKISLQPVIDRNINLKNIYSNSWYRKISEHNSKLIPELKPIWKAFMEGNMKTFNKLATKEDLEVVNKYKNPKAFIDYLNDEQETAARAISSNIADYIGKKSQWNLPQLEKFFTPEGIKKLKDNVWNVGFGLGGIVFEYSDYNY